MNTGVRVQAWRHLEVPVVVACWLVGYWAPWLPPASGTAWLAIAAWIAAHGLHNLAASGMYVTVAATVTAVLGAIFRVGYVTSKDTKNWQGQLGLFLTCAPLCVLLSAESAIFFLAAAAALAVVGWWINRSPKDECAGKPRPPFWKRLLCESFPVLSSVCFLTLSWQYNAQWLTRGLLVAAGTALLARAVVPAKEPLV